MPRADGFAPSGRRWRALFFILRRWRSGGVESCRPDQFLAKQKLVDPERKRGTMIFVSITVSRCKIMVVAVTESSLPEPPKAEKSRKLFLSFQR
ncbi:MAG: hypothetical protein HY208_04950 [Nitrospirae bacterium]|nr:hypothetical protein [Nitrospirota bacterium]